MTEQKHFLDALGALGFTELEDETNEDDLSSRVYRVEKGVGGKIEIVIGQTPRGGDDKGYMCWSFDHNGKLVDHGTWEY